VVEVYTISQQRSLETPDGKMQELATGYEWCSLGLELVEYEAIKSVQ